MAASCVPLYQCVSVRFFSREMRDCSSNAIAGATDQVVSQDVAALY
jgi:hypothetical protein